MSSNAVILRKKVTTLDKIRKYYLKGEESVTLSPKQDAIRVNIYKAWNLMINYHSKEQAVSVLANDGASRAQAYRYVNDSLLIFGDILKNHKEAKRYLIEEDLMRLQQRAIRDKDGALELKVIAQRIKIGGFDKDSDPNFDPEKMQAQTYILKAHPSVLKMIEANQDGGSIDFNALDTEDVDFERVNEEEDED
ncbi:hypothetical protein [Flavobacterium sp. 14A]|uniref:hypothetical protein n=1 Tax=Flavobacterium sp. 14A TaxID=2735896 RepID=UPI00156EEF04|nr:hypothetical protein [Flavobacterium sp. 14A]NRT11526.1 hypothetical protein [Flavobacterium sp. 14A]